MRSQLKLQAVLASTLLAGGLGVACSNSSNFAIDPDQTQPVSAVSAITSPLSDLATGMADSVMLTTPLADVRARQIVIVVQETDFPVESFDVNGATFSKQDSLFSLGQTRYRTTTFSAGQVSLDGVATFDIPGIGNTCVLVRRRFQILADPIPSTACDTPTPTPTPAPTATPNPGTRPVCEDADLPPFTNQLSISNVTQFENQSPFEFMVQLNRGPDHDTDTVNNAVVVVDFATRDDLAQGQDSARADQDYEPRPANPDDPLPFLVFEQPNGEQIQTQYIKVELVPELEPVIEGDERFLVDLLNECNADIITPTGVGTILNDTLNVLINSSQSREELVPTFTSRPVVVGGTPPFTFTVSPDSQVSLDLLNRVDLSLDPTLGNFIGTPNVSPSIPNAGDPPEVANLFQPNVNVPLDITLNVEDGAGLEQDFRFLINVITNNPILNYNEDTFPFTEAQVSTTGEPTVTDGNPPFRFSIVGGTLPPGLILNQDTGEISGAPVLGTSAASPFIITVRVEDFDEDFDDDTISIVVEPPMMEDGN